MPQPYLFTQKVSDVVDQAIAETIGSTASNLTAHQPKSMVRQVDLIQRDLINAAHTRHHFKGFSWKDKRTNFQTKQGTTLNGALTTASITAPLTLSTSFPASGRVWVMTTKRALDFLDYTGNAANILTGVTGITIPHSTAEQVEQLYALPSDFAKVKQLLVDTQEYVYADYDTIPYAGTFGFVDGYILLPQNIGLHDCRLKYSACPTRLNTSTASVDNSGTDLTKTLDVPDDFFPYMVEMLKSYIFRNRRMMDKAAECREIARGPQYDQGETGGMLSEYLAYDASMTTGNLILSPW